MEKEEGETEEKMLELTLWLCPILCLPRYNAAKTVVGKQMLAP